MNKSDNVIAVIFFVLVLSIDIAIMSQYGLIALSNSINITGLWLLLIVAISINYQNKDKK